MGEILRFCGYWSMLRAVRQNLSLLGAGPLLMTPEITVKCSCGGNNANCFKCDGRGFYSVNVPPNELSPSLMATRNRNLDTSSRHKKKRLLSKPKRYEEIGFHFLSALEDTTLTGSVLIREHEMVLDIRDPRGASTYLIVGKSLGTYFKGVNSDHASAIQIEASWADLGGLYVGLWVENGEEFMFSFGLSTRQSRNVRRPK